MSWTHHVARERARLSRAQGALFWSVLAVGSLGAGMAAGSISNRFAAEHGAEMPVMPDEVLAALKARLPRTRISRVACEDLGGLCEVVAGTTLFYTDRTARYLVIGRVYDMETHADLTATRLLALNPDLLAAGGARRLTGGDAEEAQVKGAPRVKLSELPTSGAIRWGPRGGLRAVVLSDFACSYCKRLKTELQAIGAHVEERPISIFGEASRAAAERVLCAADPARALHAAYEHQEIPEPRKCDTSGLDANEAFAKRHGLSGTPVIIRSDGAVLQGYRPAKVLRAFLAGGAA